MARNGIDPRPLCPRRPGAKTSQSAEATLSAYRRSTDRLEYDYRTSAPKEWSGIDEFLAADLAVATIALRDARLRLADEDPVILIRPRGAQMINPLMPIVSSLVNQTLRLAGRLRLSAQNVDAEDNVTTATARKRKHSAEVREKLAEDDNLISRPRPIPVQ